MATARLTSIFLDLAEDLTQNLSRVLLLVVLVFGCTQLALAQSSASEAGISKVESLGMDIPEGFYLSNPYPNPFKTDSNIRFAVDDTQTISITLHDMLGREIKNLFQGEVGADSEYTLTISGSGLKRGVYLVKLVGKNFSSSRTVALIK